MIVCVTGKIGTGKSTVSKFFESKGFKYIDVDKVGHLALELLSKKIEEEFGTCDRKKLGQIVFSDSEKLKKLESIVHPLMHQIIEKEIQSSQGNVVVEAAILRRLCIECDLIITVTAPESIIIERLKERYTPEHAKRILSMQEDILEEGIVVENTGSVEKLHKTLEKIYESSIKK